MAEVAGGQAGVLLVELAGKQDVFRFQSPDVYVEPGEEGGCGVEEGVSAHRQKHMGQFLNDLRRGAQSFSAFERRIEKRPRDIL